ncbi:MAG: DMT family transporter [Anaerolineae bacterium]|nr:DMT family transporter [Anaerolineae bacterium]MDW8171853.1 DMT family transporter [Anaerolineae bacterium]
MKIIQLSPQRLMIALLLFATMLWGMAFIFAKSVTQTTDTLTYMAARFALASGLMALVYRRRLRGLTLSEAAQGLWVGSFMFVAIILMTEGLRETSASVAGFLTSLYVVFVPFVAAVWIREPLRPTMIGASSVAFLGLVVMTLDGSSFSLRFSPGEVLLLLSALVAALHIVAVSRYAHSMDSSRLTFMQLFAVALFSVLAMPFSETSLYISPQAWLEIAIMAIFMTVVTFSIMTAAQRVISSTQATLFYALEPLWTALFGLWVGERIALQHWIGGLLIVAALLLGSLSSDWATVVRYRIGQFAFVRREKQQQAQEASTL